MPGGQLCHSFRRVLVETHRQPLVPSGKDCKVAAHVPVYRTTASTPTTAEEVGTSASHPNVTKYLFSVATVPPTNGSYTEGSSAATLSEVTPSDARSLPPEDVLDTSTTGLSGMTSDASSFLPLNTTVHTHLTSIVTALPGHRPEAAVALKERCTLPKDAGTACSDYSLKWYHEETLGVCARFWYRGCGGNANRFETEQECLEICIAKNRHPENPKVEEIPNSVACTEPWDVGPCHSFQPRWFFNSTSVRCERFWYGGCGGNTNRFENRERCKSACLNALHHP
ncbi:tissue factor pathway inhibitor-like isoform X2 [Ambystoma mexicanum]|uniref:tissue factor pathway inhibitor-like isoform X2 n=1 Tax=Ambystoma mexicanum TaxID=8296 RepID=UPI0037E954EB